jgi:hypothetical protein
MRFIFSHDQRYSTGFSFGGAHRRPDAQRQLGFNQSPFLNIKVSVALRHMQLFPIWEMLHLDLESAHPIFIARPAPGSFAAGTRRGRFWDVNDGPDEDNRGGKELHFGKCLFLIGIRVKGVGRGRSG